MARIAIGVEYFGAAYSGWQRQRHVASVQQQLEMAIAKVANQPISLNAAGRTDKAVHATAQVAHFDTSAVRAAYNWLCGINTNLPSDIAVTWVKEVSADFHARYSACGRRYCYVIYNSLSPSAILCHKVNWQRLNLCTKRMQTAAASLIGEHDFTSFRGASCQSKSPVRCIRTININRSGSFVYINIYGDSFLQHMVRNIAGVLIAIGNSQRDISWCEEVLKARDRTKGGVTAAAAGLYLAHVEYAPKWGIDQPCRRPQFYFR